MGRVATALLTAVLLVACGPHTASVHPPAEPLRSQQNARWLAVIREQASSGDWLVIRGYKGTDDMIARVTNIPITHAAVLDVAGDQVIEADVDGVHARPLADFVDHAHRLLIIRPRWWSEKRGRAAVKRAVKLVGRPYDFLGTVGIGASDRFYCSELCVAVYQRHIRPTDRLPVVMEPGQMYLWGRVLFDSGARDEE